MAKLCLKIHTCTLYSTLDEAALLEALERRGIVDQIMNTLDLSGLSEGSGVTEQRVSVSNVTTPRPAKMEVEECGNVESSPQTKSRLKTGIFMHTHTHT